MDAGSCRSESFALGAAEHVRHTVVAVVPDAAAADAAAVVETD